MPRPILPEDNIHPSIQNQIASYHSPLIDEVRAAINKHPVVIVGMRQNPFPKKARKMLDISGIPHHDIDCGNYFSKWHERLSLKMWTGWPTFPMIFVRGIFVGGYEDLKKLKESGELKNMLIKE